MKIKISLFVVSMFWVISLLMWHLDHLRLNIILMGVASDGEKTFLDYLQSVDARNAAQAESSKWKGLYEVNKAAAMQFSNDASTLEKERDQWKRRASDLSNSLYSMRQDYDKILSSSSQSSIKAVELDEQNQFLRKEQAAILQAFTAVQDENKALSNAPSPIYIAPPIYQPPPITGATIMDSNGNMSTVDFH